MTDTHPMKDDGSFYAKGGRVWRSPIGRKTETGTNYTLGFPVCRPEDALGDDGADTLAAILNQALAAGFIDGPTPIPEAPSDDKAELLAALRAMCVSHENLYRAHFGEQSDPMADIIRRDAEAAIARAERT